ncbi:putative lipoprotein [Myxococcus stipitatus DSM 14675]|uniref:Putative lipoprotein n=1 Tax=Myxococcus stipitatus (strain DSM 14675 / JCM 12634 / Mx s8) TaxID=1278073 RepID=L7U4P2_MYXSD|nr:hypothetical protein [Myxococcus stipitatus]AGC43796.1 putative lipoprotein [Myxococcus stipitatus DSM 14675]
MRMFVFGALIISTVGCGAHSRQPAPSATQTSASPTASVDDAELRRVQARAYAIVASEYAAIAATDALLGAKDVVVDPARMQMNLTVSHEGAWYGLFGKLDETGNFIPAVAWKAPLETPQWMERVPVESLPTDFSGPARAGVTARRIAEESFGRETVNPVVLREDSGELTVYTLQGTHEQDRLYFGGDLRIRFSSDGRSILQQEKLHTGVITVELVREGEKRTTGSVHSHVLFQGPLETELATMMLYPFLDLLTVFHAERDDLYLLRPDGSIRISSQKTRRTRVLQPDGTFSATPETEE